MNENNNDLNGLSRRQLYSLIDGLKRENNYLKTNSLKTKTGEEFNDNESEMKTRSDYKRQKNYLCDWEGCGKGYTKRDVLNRHVLYIHKGCQPKYPCDGCDYVAISLGHLNRHKLKHSDERQFKCLAEDCIKVFKSEYELTVHRLAVHPEVCQHIQWIQCSHNGCEYKTKSKGYFNKHLRNHCKPFVCPSNGCVFRSDTESDLLQHKCLHSNETTFVCSVNECQKEFKSESYLKGHQLYSHPEVFDDKPWIGCDYNGCDYKTKTKSHLNKHLRSHCKPFACDLCGKGFSTLYTLRQHKDIHSGNVRKFRCEWYGCERVFHTFNIMKDHMNTHTGQLSHPCLWPDCEKTFQTKSALNIHRVKHEQKYRCDWKGCGFVGRCGSQLSTHKVKHSEERHFRCSFNDCDKRYKREDQLRLHQLVVHPEVFTEKPWIECTHNGCEYKTKERQRFNEHSISHSKPFVCDLCGKGFSSLIALTRHNHTIHLANNDWKVRCEWSGCERLFGSISTMKDHMNTHTGQLSYSCRWPECDKTYTTKQSLGFHMRGHKLMACHRNGCEFQTTNEIKLKYHEERHEMDSDINELIAITVPVP